MSQKTRSLRNKKAKRIANLREKLLELPKFYWEDGDVEVALRIERAVYALSDALAREQITNRIRKSKNLR